MQVFPHSGVEILRYDRDIIYKVTEVSRQGTGHVLFLRHLNLKPSSLHPEPSTANYKDIFFQR